MGGDSGIGGWTGGWGGVFRAVGLWCVRMVGVRCWSMLESLPVGGWEVTVGGVGVVFLFGPEGVGFWFVRFCFFCCFEFSVQYSVTP